jgi:3-phenylpropionate/trans-cinnamate dioxygenase ferredoxin subunit
MGLLARATGAALHCTDANPSAPDGIGRRCVSHVIETLDICPIFELPPGTARVVEWEDLEIGIFNCNGTLYAIEDRCSHDNGTLAEGEIDEDACTVECPRHGALFDLRTGKPKTLPAYVPVETFDVRVEDDMIKLEVE